MNSQDKAEPTQHTERRVAGAFRAAGPLSPFRAPIRCGTKSFVCPLPPFARCQAASYGAEGRRRKRGRMRLDRSPGLAPTLLHDQGFWQSSRQSIRGECAPQPLEAEQLLLLRHSTRRRLLPLFPPHVSFQTPRGHVLHAGKRRDKKAPKMQRVHEGFRLTTNLSFAGQMGGDVAEIRATWRYTQAREAGLREGGAGRPRVGHVAGIWGSISER